MGFPGMVPVPCSVFPVPACSLIPYVKTNPCWINQIHFGKRPLFEFAFGQRRALEFSKCILAGVHDGFADETKVFFMCHATGNKKSGKQGNYYSGPDLRI